MGYAFISYSSKRMIEATSLYQQLKKNHIDTWMAPGDIPAGSQYAESISRAIRGCSCFILMLTEESQQSVWVAKETERAVNYNKIIIPVKIDEIVLNDSFELYISSNHIIPVKCFDESSEQLQSLLKVVRLYTQEPPESAKPQEQASKAEEPICSTATIGRGSVIHQKYVVEEYLGSNSYDKSYIARDLTGDQKVYIRVLEKNGGRSKDIEARMRKQMQLLNRIRYPAIVSMIESLEDERYIVVIEEYVSGKPLPVYVNEQPVNTGTAIRMGKELCEIAGFLQTIHPPITPYCFSPGDYVVRDDGRLILTNLDMTFEEADIDCSLMGTYFYSAPEQLGGKRIDQRTYVYLIGLVLYCITSTSTKNSSYTYELTSFERLKNRRTYNADLPKTLLEIILKCCNMDPDRRYQTIHDLMVALDDLETGKSSKQSKGSLLKKIFGKHE